MVSEDDEHDDASEADAEEAEEAEEAERSTSPVEERVGSGETDGDSASAADDEAAEADTEADDGGSDPSVSPVVERLGSGRDDDSGDTGESTADDEWTDDGDESESADDEKSTTAADDSGESAVDGEKSTPAADDSEEGTAEVEVARQNGSALAAIVSFIVPGLGHVVNGDNERGAIIFLVYMAWVFLAWGIGFLIIGTFISVVTLGLGIIVQAMIALVLVPVDIIFHVVAAIDAYQRSDMVDKVTVKVDELR